MSNEHPKELKLQLEFSLDLRQLAESIEELSYDEGVRFLDELGSVFDERAQKDVEAGRKKLAQHLQVVVYHLENARNELDRAWKICETNEPPGS